jgi:hypothetical protein
VKFCLSLCFLLAGLTHGWSQGGSISVESTNGQDFLMKVNGFLVDSMAATSYFMDGIDNEIIRLRLESESGMVLFNENVRIQLDKLSAFMFDSEAKSLNLIAQSEDFSVEFLLFSANKYNFLQAVRSKKEPITYSEDPIKKGDFIPDSDTIQIDSKKLDTLANEVTPLPLDTNIQKYSLTPFCERVLKADDLEELINGLGTTPYGAIQLRMIQNKLKDKCVSTEQLGLILDELNDDELKLETLRKVKPMWMDPFNGARLSELFQFQYAKKEFFELIKP